MTNPKSRIIAAVAGTFALGAVAWAEPTQQERIQALEAQVAELQATRAQNTQDLAATIDSVLRDAERRSQLMAAGGDMGAGYDSGFYIRGTNWEVRPGAHFQFRGVADFRDDGDDDDDIVDDIEDDTEAGFEIRRMKFSLEGYAVTKNLTYSFIWATDREGGGVYLEDAVVKYMFADVWGIRAGQYKDPVNHEELTSSKRLLAADRSMLNELLAGGVLDRTQGMSLVYGDYDANTPIYGELMLHDGLNEDNTNFTDHTFEVGVSGRVEFKAMGDWKSYRDFSAMNNKENLLVFGGGFDWSNTDDGADGDDGDIWTLAFDAQFETDKLGIFGAAIVRNIDEELLGSDDDMTDWGFLLQGGYMLNPSWELFARYDVTIFDEDVIADEDTFQEVTIGLNYFLGDNGSAGHRAKITVDFTWLPDGSPAELDGLGILGGSNEDEYVLRGQFQLVI
jgi:hypothetical protein